MTGPVSHFVGGDQGEWSVMAMTTLCGPPLGPVEAIAIDAGTAPDPFGWVLRGAASNLRYTGVAARDELRARQAGLGRPEADCAALIPIRKSEAWWALAQDERQAIFDLSLHTPIGLDYLPAVARRLYHGRDLGEPFDFLTWFEFKEADSDHFDALLVRLRATREWQYVVGEVDIRLRRKSGCGPGALSRTGQPPRMP